MEGLSDAGTDEGGTFACGPTKRCLEATEYCRVTGLLAAGTIVVPLDGSKLTPTYACLALPPCDAADECTCLPGTGVLLAQSIIVIGSSCSCSDQDGGITQTCTSGGLFPEWLVFFPYACPCPKPRDDGWDPRPFSCTGTGTDGRAALLVGAPARLVGRAANLVTTATKRARPRVRLVGVPA